MTRFHYLLSKILFLLFVFVCFLVFFVFANRVSAATEFISTINKTGQDYDTLTLWENAIDSNLTSAQTRVYKVSSVTGTVADGAIVNGQTNGYTATVLHVNNAATSPRQVMVVHDTANEYFANNEVLQVDVSNYITLTSNAGDTDDTVIAVAECYNDDGPVSDALLISGWTTSATNYIKIYAPVGERHNGTAGTGFVLQNNNTAASIYWGNQSVYIEWIEIDGYGYNWVGITKVAGSLPVYLNHLLVHDTGTEKGMSFPSTDSVQIYNCILYDNFDGIYTSAQSTTIQVWNCTVYNASRYGILRTLTKNTYVGKSATGDYYSPATGSDYLVSSDTTANVVTNYATGKTSYTTYFVNTTGGSENLHLKNTSNNLWGLSGADLSGTFTDDIDGETRSAWDIGADEYVVSTYNQSAYRWFNNADSTDVGTVLANQDTAATLGSAGDAFRLRMLLHTASAQLDQSGQNFKLQFVGKGAGTCSSPSGGTPATYTDVTGATVIAYKDNTTPADGASLTANANDPTHGADTIVNQTYEELNNFTNSVAAIPAGQDGKWDFALYDNSAPAGTVYCLRAVKADGTALGTYTVYPEVTTAAAPSPTFNQSAYRFFNNTDTTDVGTALANQDTAAMLGSAGAIFRLRMLLHVASAQLDQSGQNFKLQFVGKGTGTCAGPSGGTPSTYTDVTGATVIAYKDNTTPADGATLTANANDPTHSTDDIVVQTYEEANNFTNSVAAIPVGDDGKWDFALYDNSAPAGTVYCLRAVKADGTALGTYTVYPEITTVVPSLTLAKSGTTLTITALDYEVRFDSSLSAGVDAIYDLVNDPSKTVNLIAEANFAPPPRMPRWWYHGIYRTTAPGINTDNFDITNINFQILENTPTRGIIQINSDSKDADFAGHYQEIYVFYPDRVNLGYTLTSDDTYNNIDFIEFVLAGRAEATYNRATSQDSVITTTEGSGDNASPSYSGTPSTEDFLMNWRNDAGTSRYFDWAWILYDHWAAAERLTTTYLNYLTSSISAMNIRDLSTTLNAGTYNYYSQFQFGTSGGSVLPDLNSNTAVQPYSDDYRIPDTPAFATGSIVGDGFNEAEGVYTMQCSTGIRVETTLEYDRGGATNYTFYKPSFLLSNYTASTPPAVEEDATVLDSLNSHSISINETTVDQDSSSGQTTLYVANTTGLAANDWVSVGYGTDRAEWAKISSVTAGVSLTLSTNLVYTHTAVQEDAVFEPASYSGTAYNSTVLPGDRAIVQLLGNYSEDLNLIFDDDLSAAASSLTFSISDNSIGFGALDVANERWATGDASGSASEVAAHTITASTNASSGYSITVNGATLASGGNTINAIGASAADVTAGNGTEQFGIRLTASGGNGAVSAPYNGAANNYALDTAAFPDQVASDSDGDDVATTYSVFYAVNIAATTEAGTYSSALTYVITGNF